MKRLLDDLPVKTQATDTLLPAVFVVLPDFLEDLAPLSTWTNSSGGRVLSAVFLFATVLMKTSEGYEDQPRFAIMQKVGMTRKEIRKSINSQMKTVFFLPLLAAGLHMAFAFPIINRILPLLGMSNTSLFLITTLVSFLIFSLFYAIVYLITSEVYYRIVNGKKSGI